MAKFEIGIDEIEQDVLSCKKIYELLEKNGFKVWFVDCRLDEKRSHTRNIKSRYDDGRE